jgi:hypothetical protein
MIRIEDRTSWFPGDRVSIGLVGLMTHEFLLLLVYWYAFMNVSV